VRSTELKIITIPPGVVDTVSDVGHHTALEAKFKILKSR
jgi:hypothetical protein